MIYWTLPVHMCVLRHLIDTKGLIRNHDISLDAIVH